MRIIDFSSDKTISEKKLLGTWERKFRVGYLQKDHGEKVSLFHKEVIQFFKNKTFSIGELNIDNKYFYEHKGTWRLSKDKKKIELFHSFGKKEINIVGFKEYSLSSSLFITAYNGNIHEFSKIKDRSKEEYKVFFILPIIVVITFSLSRLLVMLSRIIWNNEAFINAINESIIPLLYIPLSLIISEASSFKLKLYYIIIVIISAFAFYYFTGNGLLGSIILIIFFILRSIFATILNA